MHKHSGKQRLGTFLDEAVFCSKNQEATPFLNAALPLFLGKHKVEEGIFYE